MTHRASHAASRTHMANHSYHGYSHEQLRAMLDSAEPTTVENTHAAAWRAVDQALGELGEALNATVIHGRWSGPAAEEFQRRLSAVAECAGSSSNTAHRLWNGLDYLAEDIRIAQREMPDVPSRTVLAGGTGPGGMVASSAGFTQSLTARKKAADRAEQVMTEMGCRMQVSAEYWWPRELPPAPSDMPHTPGYRTMTWRTSGPGTRPSPPPGTGTDRQPADRSVSAGPVHAVHIDQPGTAAPVQPDHRSPGTALAGLGGPVAAGAGQVGLPGLAGSGTAAPAGAAGLAATPVSPGMAAGGSGLAAARRPAGTPRLAGPAEEPVTGRAGGSIIGATNRGRRSDEAEEYSTWLTEDDMVWQDRPAPPSVIE